MGDTFQYIRDLQFVDKARAETLLLAFMQANYPLDVVKVELRPQATSLNSFNGFLTRADGGRLFFKTHTEGDTLIHEYYNADLLAQAGYPIIRPVYKSSSVGKQLLVYDLIEDPAVFDLAWASENGADDSRLAAAQQTADEALFGLYTNTLAPQTADEAAQAPIHQMFSHRLTGGRLDRFYGSLTRLVLPDHTLVRMDTVRRKTWIINGQVYSETLNDLIRRAVRLLNPAQAGPSIIGHGDAHNGNVFFRPYVSAGGALVYFDPAFAGRHHPLLDLVKPLFHNVFAMWMYFPHEMAARVPVSLRQDGETWHMDYTYPLPSVREMFLTSKLTRVLRPTLALLREKNMLREDWRVFLKAALFCCPLLTMNLTDDQRFPPAISLLGLAMAVEMGAESREKRSVIDRWLDQI